MVKKIGFSTPNWVIEEIISKKPQGANRSEWITELLIKGYRSMKEYRSIVPPQEIIYNLLLFNSYNQPYITA